MANGDDLHLPLEIPWRLASTTQLLTAGEPDETTISLFTFQPDDEVLTSQFPDQSLVFLKVTVSISPAAFPPGTSPVAASALGEGIPCYHVLLDMKVRKATGELGTDRPYFHAAAPLRRQMLQTGVIGTDVFEGESDGQFMGKSGSQMYETSGSHSTTSSRSAGFNVLGIGVSGRTSTTDVTSSRDVTQVSDTTTREASQERRELVSHMTKVENVLTLLNAKYVGTPYLSFSLSPQPLQQLSVDSSDPSLWFGQLLQRRSSGIEGVQEFTTVVVVPKGEDFCVTARLRRVCLLDDPPGPPNFDERFNFSTAIGRCLNYLFDAFPVGTPLDELDVDITQALTPPERFQRPVIKYWPVHPGEGLIFASVVSPGAVMGEINQATVNYKHMLEVWLETLRDEYERDLVRSPLERGVLMGENRQLDTCFTFGPDGVLNLLNSSSSVSPLALLPIGPGDLDVGGVQSTAISVRSSTKARALETVMRWNALERQLATLLGNLRGKFPDKPGKLNDLRIVRVLVDRWAKLRSDDPRNLDFKTAMDALKLNEKHRRLLKAAGVTDLKSLARALKAAPIVERYNDDMNRQQKELKPEPAAAPPVEPIKFPISQKEAEQIRKVIGDSLFGEAEPAPPVPLTMHPRPGVNRIKLGPIVGHTDHQSTRIWIQVLDDPSIYALRVQGVGIFNFISTEGDGALEFRTATAVAQGLRPDLRYRYNVLRLGRIIANGKGSFRTMPDPGSMAHLTFCAISCNKAESEGAWKALGKFVEDSQPQFILMMGDQLYLDEDGLDVFGTHKNSTPSVRRKAIAEKYHVNWSREPVRKVLANVPVYMLWDDHDLRDGWGSSASDSETLVAKHTRGRAIFEKCRAYYEDCRDAYWHFQACHNPRPSQGVDPALPNYIDGPPSSSERYAMPYAFRCGRLVVLILDSRGVRDVFREELPILGPTQWQFIEHVFANLAEDVEALAVITPTPLASLDPEGQVQKLMGNRTDDVEAFKKGDEQNTLVPESSGDPAQFAVAVLNKHLSVLANMELNLGNFKIGNIDEARDQWSHKYSRPEQRALLRAAGKARLSNRTAGAPRGLIFISGDIHVGARFKVTCSDPSYEALSLTSSGISVVFGKQPVVHALLSEDFDVAPGIHSSLQEVVTEFNFGIVQVIPTGRGAEVQGVVAHEGNSLALGLDFGLFL